MSDSENSDPRPTPSKQTSSVPLKKETVRVTLKAADAPMAPPPAVAGEIQSSAPPVVPPAPSVPRPPTAQVGPAPAPAPTIPLKTASGGPVGKPAPTIRLATPTGAGAPTIQLKSPSIPVRPAPVGGGEPTQPGGPSVQLPKATVQLQPTQPLHSAGPPSMSQAATIRTADDEEEATVDTVSVVLSILGFVAAIAVLGFQIMTANIWVEGEWDRLIQ